MFNSKEFFTNTELHMTSNVRSIQEAQAAIISVLKKKGAMKGKSQKLTIELADGKKIDCRLFFSLHIINEKEKEGKKTLLYVFKLKEGLNKTLSKQELYFHFNSSGINNEDDFVLLESVTSTTSGYEGNGLGTGLVTTSFESVERIIELTPQLQQQKIIAHINDSARGEAEGVQRKGYSSALAKKLGFHQSENSGFIKFIQN